MSTRPTAPAHRLRSLRRRRLSRRSLLTASARAGVGAAALALVGCSDDESAQQQTQQAEQAQQAQQAQAEEAAAQQQAQEQTTPPPAQQAEQQQAAQSAPPSGPSGGGVIRMWLPVERHDRWDPHRSRYRYTQAALSLMYNRLVQPASVSSGELEADLCALPEMPDETTYVFTIEPAAAFWNLEPTNGRALTAQDIAWNIQRQRDALDASGAPDPHFFRRAAYERTASTETASDSSITLTTAEPDAAYLGSVHASPFAWITSPEAAEMYGDDWRDDPSDIMRSSGSGPYAPRLYDGFELALARSENWWRPDSAWADGITFSSGDINGIAGLYDAGGVDRADFPLTNETVEALRERHPQHPSFELPLDAPVELLAPLGDPRTARAVGLAIDRAQLLERLYGDHGAASGPLPWYLDGWSLSESQLGAFSGYRNDRDADLAEVAALAGAAGGGEAVSLVVADLFEGFFPGSGEAVRSMIAEATGLEVELEDRPFVEALDQLRGGERFCFLGWGAVPQQADPTDDWRSSLHSAGERNWSGRGDAELDALIERMRTTFNFAARQGLARQVQEMLLSGDAPQWRIALVNGVQLGIHQPWLHPDPRLFEFAWSTHRLSASWLDVEQEGYPADRELPPLEEAAEAGG